MLTGVMALVGVLIGAALCLVAGALSERRRDRRHARRQAAGAKRACYQRTVLALDDLLAMRSDNPDLGRAVRAMTADVTELRLIAPVAVAQLADVCVQAALQSGGDPAPAAQLRARLIDAIRDDLLGSAAAARTRPKLPAVLPMRRTAPQHPARHARPRRV